MMKLYKGQPSCKYHSGFRGGKEGKLFNNMKKMIIFTFVFCICICLVATVKEITTGDNCRNVRIQIKNNLAQEIKIVKVQYRDYDKEKWRNETTWAPLRIAPGITRSRTRNLEHVKNDRTRVRIFVFKHWGGSTWRSYRVQSTIDFTCTIGRTIKFEVY